MQKALILVALAASVVALPNAKAAVTTTSKTTSKVTTMTTTTTKPSTTSPACATSTNTATFEKLGGLSGVPLNPIPVPYMGLDFQGFQYIIEIPTAADKGIAAHSGNSVGFSNIQTTLLGGAAEWTVNYARSTVKSFSPSSFYYGCVLNGENGAIDAPTACTITVTGFSGGDNTANPVQVAVQTFTYKPSSALAVQQMVQGTFNPAFQNLQYVSFKYVSTGTTKVLTADLGLVIDDVVFTTCT